MARVTVEDCVDKVANPFDLVVLAAYRTREILSGSPITVEQDGDKYPVVSLREIANETQSSASLYERLIESHQVQIEIDEPEEDAVALGYHARSDNSAIDEMDEESMLLRSLMEAQREA